MELIILYIVTSLYLIAQAFEHKYHIQHANNIDRLNSISKWHLWANIGRVLVITSFIILLFYFSFTAPVWKVLILFLGLGIYSGYFFSIFLNIIRKQKWNYRGSIDKKDIDYYMFGGVTHMYALWGVITTIILYFKL